MKDLTNKLREFAAERDWEQFHSPKNLVMALIVETAELVEHFQWLTPEQSENLSQKDKEKISEEVADILIYLTRFCDIMDIDLIKAAFEKIDENSKKYPANIVRGKALKYKDY